MRVKNRKFQNDSRIKKTVVVLGNAKSGTSVVAGVLYILGVDIGKKFVEADGFNPKGYFEDYDFVNLTDAIFEAAKTNYWDFPSHEKLLAQKKNFDSRIRTLIRKKEKDKRIWGWKDPWTNILIDLFLPYLTNPYFIVIFRNPLAIAKSAVTFTKGKQHEFWVKRPITLFHGLKLANFYDRIILDFLEKYQKLPQLFIAFEDIIENPTRETKRVTKFLGITPTKQQIDRILDFVMPRNKVDRERKRFKNKSIN
ncbi:MAG: hypothetical protein CO146_00810 [Candidatus Nealsonbacteria bacterium CG_4_9_14_3_um_filter_37_29]|uniref:Sulfotransferase domain-containing protein n=1 Tax=Candidatus Nealsonbacteria bacterium CG_4_9_14_3_um_filter_37_29 TaxID=1974696 RepID=A0A2M7Z3Q0_9BACT|nr:MAG: hypothetical protein CO146_00810 [Candidatus Nealsonbacteria bacterium CG_4_9_14_3_um_filter_37_29]